MNLVNILNLEPDYIKDNSEVYFNEGISNLLDGYFHSMIYYIILVSLILLLIKSLIKNS